MIREQAEVQSATNLETVLGECAVGVAHSSMMEIGPPGFEPVDEGELTLSLLRLRKSILACVDSGTDESLTDEDSYSRTELDIANRTVVEIARAGINDNDLLGKIIDWLEYVESNTKNTSRADSSVSYQPSDQAKFNRAITDWY